uniref:Uncharacterized protein n=1 Tax=Marseillevirus LCMAC103 TaxID=2506604 RepID=A0A481YUC2_9VIRU|nr:MAG: uncharacterized protein LCMAC103_00380 [Marseillevirus LCMAC103]
MSRDDAKEIQALFDELTKTAPSVVDAIEASFKTMCAGGTAEQKSRKEERAALNARIADVKKELRKCHNIRNIKRVTANRRRADKRRRLKDELSSLKFRLADIRIEVENET